jgi:hypothetical protein
MDFSLTPTNAQAPAAPTSNKRAPRSPLANEARAKIAAAKGQIVERSVTTTTFAADPHTKTGDEFEEIAFEEVAKALYDEVVSKASAAGFASRIGSKVDDFIKGMPHYHYLGSLAKNVAAQVQRSVTMDPVSRVLERFCGEWSDAAVTGRHGSNGAMTEGGGESASGVVANAIDSALQAEARNLFGGTFTKAVAARAESGISKRSHNSRAMRTTDIAKRLDATHNDERVLEALKEWLSTWGQTVSDEVSVQEPEDFALDADKIKADEPKLVQAVAHVLHEVLSHAIKYDHKTQVALEAAIVAVDPHLKMLDWHDMLNRLVPVNVAGLESYSEGLVTEWLQFGREYMKRGSNESVARARKIVHEARGCSGLMPDRDAVGEEGTEPVIGRSTDFQHEPYPKDSMVVKKIGQAEAAHEWPVHITHEGRTYHKTGKVGTNRRTGQPAAEYQADNGGERVWLLASGAVVSESITESLDDVIKSLTNMGGHLEQTDDNDGGFVVRNMVTGGVMSILKSKGFTQKWATSQTGFGAPTKWLFVRGAEAVTVIKRTSGVTAVIPSSPNESVEEQSITTEPPPRPLSEVDFRHLSWAQVKQDYIRTTHHDLPSEWKPFLAKARDGIRKLTAVEKLYKTKIHPGGGSGFTSDPVRAGDVRLFLNDLLASFGPLRAAADALANINTPKWAQKVNPEPDRGNTPSEMLWLFYDVQIRERVRDAQEVFRKEDDAAHNALEDLAGLDRDAMADIGVFNIFWWDRAFDKKNYGSLLSAVKAIEDVMEWLQYFYDVAIHKAAQSQPVSQKGELQPLGDVGPWKLYASVQPGEEGFSSSLIRDFHQAAVVALKGFRDKARVPDRAIAGKVVLERHTGRLAGAGGTYSTSTDIVAIAPGHSVESMADTIAHEVGHRVWFRAIGSRGRDAWTHFCHTVKKPFPPEKATALAYSTALGTHASGYQKLKAALDSPDPHEKEQAHQLISHNASLSSSPDDRSLAGTFEFYFQWNHRSGSEQELADKFVEWMKGSGYSDEFPTKYSQVDPTEAWPEVIANLVVGGAAKTGQLAYIEVHQALGTLRESVDEAKGETCDICGKADGSSPDCYGVSKMPNGWNVCQPCYDENADDYKHFAKGVTEPVV